MPPTLLTPLRRALAVVVASFALALAGAQTDPFEQLQQSAREWARIKDALSQLESNWQWEQEWIKASLAATQAEETRLLATKRRLETAAAENLSQRDRTESLAEAVDTELSELTERLNRLALTLTQLRPYLPPRLAASLELPYRTLDERDRPANERLIAATNIINRALNFNRSITLSEEPISSVEQPRQTLFEVLYWGLSHAYALDRSTGKAYFGHPHAQGWTWSEQPQIAAALRKAIAMQKGELDPAFVNLPARVIDVDALLQRSKEDSE